MRQTAQEADVVVVNHHLYFADLAIKRSSPGRAGVEVVPRHEAVVFDEAHNLEEVATEFFGGQASNWKLFDLCRDIDRVAKSRESWPERLGKLTSQLGRTTEAYFAAVAAKAPADARPAPPPPPARPREEPAPLPLFDPRAATREAPTEQEELLARSVVLAPQAVAAMEQHREARWTLEPGMLDDLAAARDDLAADIDAVHGFFKEVVEAAEAAEAADAEAALEAAILLRSGTKQPEYHSRTNSRPVWTKRARTAPRNSPPM
jgi:Rad3-related DNA helicase